VGEHEVAEDISTDGLRSSSWEDPTRTLNLDSESWAAYLSTEMASRGMLMSVRLSLDKLNPDENPRTANARPRSCADPAASKTVEADVSCSSNSARRIIRQSLAGLKYLMTELGVTRKQGSGEGLLRPTRFAQLRSDSRAMAPLGE